MVPGVILRKWEGIRHISRRIQSSGPCAKRDTDKHSRSIIDVFEVHLDSVDALSRVIADPLILIETDQETAHAAGGAICRKLQEMVCRPTGTAGLDRPKAGRVLPIGD